MKTDVNQPAAAISPRPATHQYMGTAAILAERARRAVDGAGCSRGSRRAVGGVRDAGTERRPEPVHTARVDDVRVVAGDDQIGEGAHAVVDAAPADGEGLVPRVAWTREEAVPATDAGVVEQQVDVVGL